MTETWTTVVLPERDEMLRRLKSVMDEPHAEQYLYPKLLKHAGQPKTPEGIGVMFVLAIADYTEGLPPALGITLDFMLPRFIAALVDDEDVRRATLEFIREARA